MDSTFFESSHSTTFSSLSGLLPPLAGENGSSVSLTTCQRERKKERGGGGRGGREGRRESVSECVCVCERERERERERRRGRYISNRDLPLLAGGSTLHRMSLILRP